MIKHKKGKIIRDSVHGDIFVPEKFLCVIDTIEFQRLRRIKQLSVTNRAFPSANHTRFSHSIGTYYIMGLIIDHFIPIFESLSLEMTEKEKDVLLLSALLHDIGHGPFSHVFEKIGDQKKRHEVWSIEIINDRKTQINQVIVNQFGEDYPKLISDNIAVDKSILKNDYCIESIDFSKVYKSLISSQIDADRMDYLLRDSKNCGVKFGNIDIQRMIASLSVTVRDDQFYICVSEKYLQDIESYIIARYHMQKVVYYHELKLQMEHILLAILKRAKFLASSEKLGFCSKRINYIFNETKKVSEFLQLDDAIIECCISEWLYSEDLILSKLCKIFLNRFKYQKMIFFSNSSDVIDLYVSDLKAIFKGYGYDIANMDSENFWIQSNCSFYAYDPSEDNIWILQKNGTLVDISESSEILKQKESTPIWLTKRENVFLSYEVIECLDIDNSEELLLEIEQLNEKYAARKHIEIEKKYCCQLEDFNRIDEFLENNEDYITIKSIDNVNQNDYYYDTSNFALLALGSTLRIREKKGKYELTIKQPVTNKNVEKDGNNERFEYNKSLNKHCLDMTFVSKFFPDIDCQLLTECVTIKNNRQIFNISMDNGVNFEMVYDCLTYYSPINGKSVEDYQIEIELMSEYEHRVNLKIFTDYLESKIFTLKPTSNSKYSNALKLLDIV